MSAKASLGRGFDALIPKDLDSTLMAEDPTRVQKILITDITPHGEQPRQQWDQNALDELISSVKIHGILQPIIVSKQKNGYQIVAGERRWRAAKAAGLNKIPAIVRSLQELEALELALVENIQRVDLSPLEQALAVLKLQQQFSLSLEQISKKLGKAPSTVSNISRLLQLPSEAQAALREGRISEGHARAILALNGNPGKQSELLSCIINNKWTVRQAEQFVIGIKRTSNTSNRATSKGPDEAIVSALGQKLKTKIAISRRVKGGRLNIDFDNDEQLQRIVDKLSS